MNIINYKKSTLQVDKPMFRRNRSIAISPLSPSPRQKDSTLQSKREVYFAVEESQMSEMRQSQLS